MIVPPILLRYQPNNIQFMIIKYAKGQVIKANKTLTKEQVIKANKTFAQSATR